MELRLGGIDLGMELRNNVGESGEASLRCSGESSDRGWSLCHMAAL
jgi:hypothetical protein